MIHSALRKTLRASVLAILAAPVAACSSHTVHRFPLRDPVWVDEDLRPVDVPCRPDPEDPKKKICRPEEYWSPFYWDVVDKTLFRPIVKFLSQDVGFEARNVNALDEVPDSSWFTNRIGVRPMTADEVFEGSCAGKKIIDAPRADGAWMVDMGKPNGANPGFRVNIEGVGKFLLKPDDPREGEKPSGATAIASRMYYAAGWFASCDTVAYIDRKWLRLKPGLMYEDNVHGPRPFDEATLDSMLDDAQRRNGLLRVVASRWLPGRTIGPFTYDGVRDDDPNDVIPHEDRRDLRGARIMAAWLAHFDSREQNTLTTWAAADAESKDSSPGHVVHWYMDMNDCFGSHQPWEGLNRRINHSYYFDFGDIGLDFITLGMLSRPWDHPVENKELPMFDYYRPDFDPEAWKGGYPNPAFARMTEGDAAWAARIIARFDDDLVAAAVKVGDFTDPRAAPYLTHALITRRRAILKRYLSRLSPLADPKVDGSSVCFTDLARSTGTSPDVSFHYSAGLWTGNELEHRQELAVKVGDGGKVCVELPRVVPDEGVPEDDGSRYAVLDVLNGIAKGPLRAHFYDLGSKRGFKLVAIRRPDDAGRDF